MDEILVKKEFNGWIICIKQMQDSDIRYMQVVRDYANGRIVIDYPIKYYDGKIAYDFPERIPQYVKEKVSIMFRKYSPYFIRKVEK